MAIVRFEISLSPDFQNSNFSEWIPATAANDFILKAHIDSLQPTTTYHYRAIYGSSREQTKPSPAATFKTLPAADQSAPIQFILTSCLNYAFFQQGDKTHPPAPLEGRDYRNPNDMPDGPDKSIWGTEQRAWLQRTLKESNATFKILISPTPMDGPDDGHKKDNHANLKGFDHEGRTFFKWLQQNNIDPNKFFILCGDRHWKYHSIHPYGFSEFSCGALNRENSRLGRAPGDPKSNDPDAKIRQPYTDSPACGGFLRVDLKPSNTNTAATLAVTLHDDTGKILYRHQSP